MPSRGERRGCERPGDSGEHMVLMAAFLTQVGALQTAPILIAVVTAAHRAGCPAG